MSGTGDATGLVAATGLGSSEGRILAVSDGDATACDFAFGCVAVSASGDAYGCIAVSATGRGTAGNAGTPNLCRAVSGEDVVGLIPECPPGHPYGVYGLICCELPLRPVVKRPELPVLDGCIHP